MTVTELLQLTPKTRMRLGQSQDGTRWVLRESVLWSDGPSREVASDPVGVVDEYSYESTVDLPNCTAAVLAAQQEGRV